MLYIILIIVRVLYVLTISYQYRVNCNSRLMWQFSSVLVVEL